MKPLILFALLMLVGCGKQTVPTATDHEKPKEQTKRRDEWQPQIKHVRECDYVFFHHWTSYHSESVAMLHAGDCPNPKHGEGR